MTSIWHIGIAVPDLEQGRKELGEVFGLRWRPARVRKLTLNDAAGRAYEVECHVAFSLGGPFAVEVWQAIPGTPLDMPDVGGVHHIGYWADDLGAEAKRLNALGYPGYATVGVTPLLNRGPAGTLIELCDPHSDRPSLRDLFPPGSEFAGEPDLVPPCDARGRERPASSKGEQHAHRGSPAPGTWAPRWPPSSPRPGIRSRSPLAESWRQQPGTPVYTTDLPLDAARRRWRTRPKSRPPAGAANTHSTES